MIVTNSSSFLVVNFRNKRAAPLPPANYGTLPSQLGHARSITLDSQAFKNCNSTHRRTPSNDSTSRFRLRKYYYSVLMLNIKCGILDEGN